MATVTLSLPSNILRAQKAAADPVPAFDQAIKALLREVAVLKSSLRRESEWRTVVRGQPLMGHKQFACSELAENMSKERRRI